MRRLLAGTLALLLPVCALPPSALAHMSLRRAPVSSGGSVLLPPSSVVDGLSSAPTGLATHLLFLNLNANRPELILSYLETQAPGTPNHAAALALARVLGQDDPAQLEATAAAVRRAYPDRGPALADEILSVARAKSHWTHDAVSRLRALGAGLDDAGAIAALLSSVYEGAGGRARVALVPILARAPARAGPGARALRSHGRASRR
ncbi:MAG: hypothetical protein HYZ74_07790 [Elusimicrobia bacterium]|nr:hypothetical protein [Elusimicrobiota bacterium]